MVLEHYRQDTGSCPLPGYIGSAEGVVGALSSYGVLFQPADGWARPFLYSSSSDGQHYTMLSAGSNATVEFVGIPYWADDVAPWWSSYHIVDIVIRDGEWHSFDRGKAGYARVTPDEKFLEQLKEVRDQ
jgi:hypothetical protein